MMARFKLMLLWMRPVNFQWNVEFENELGIDVVKADLWIFFEASFNFHQIIIYFFF